jgi:hypothetical protein
VHGDPLVVSLDRAEPVQARRGRKGLLASFFGNPLSAITTP